MSIENAQKELQRYLNELNSHKDNSLPELKYVVGIKDNGLCVKMESWGNSGAGFKIAIPYSWQVYKVESKW